MKEGRVDWKYYLAELAVVFTGITLAFALNRGYEDYKEGQLEARYLAGFHGDVIKDTAEVRSTLVSTRRTCDRLTSVLDDLAEEPYNYDSIMVILGEMSRYQQFFGNSVTYESIRNTGNFDIIGDFELRESLTGYYEMSKERRLVEGVFNNYVNQYFVPFVFANLDFAHQRFINKNVVRDAEFRNLLGGYLQLMKQILDFYQRLDAASRNLLEKLAG